MTFGRVRVKELKLETSHMTSHMTDLVDPQAAKWEGRAGFGVNQQHLAVQNEVITMGECLGNEFFEVLHLLD